MSTQIIMNRTEEDTSKDPKDLVFRYPNLSPEQKSRFGIESARGKVLPENLENGIDPWVEQ